GVIAQVCDRVAVMYAGEVVEESPVADLFRQPRHPYTAGLLACVPRLGADKHDSPLRPIPGGLPRRGGWGPEAGGRGRGQPEACAFAPRCELARDVCREQAPALFAAGSGRVSRCHFWPEVAGGTSPPAAPPRPPNPGGRFLGEGSCGSLFP